MLLQILRNVIYMQGVQKPSEETNLCLFIKIKLYAQNFLNYVYCFL